MAEAAKGAVGGAISGAAAGSAFGPWGTVIGGVAGGLFGFFSGSQIGEANDAAYAASYANAADLRALAEFNSAGYIEAGSINAGAIRTVGQANALAVERATSRNMMMYGMQATEDRRRKIITEEVTAGTIRATVGASGVQTNTGSPLHYLNQQVTLGIKERQYGDIKAYWTLRNMREEGADQASVIRLTADQQAMVTEYNAGLQAEMSYAEAVRQATAMERSAEVNDQIASANSTAAMVSQVSSAISTLSPATISSIGSLFSTSNAGLSTTGAYGSSIQSWGGLYASNNNVSAGGYQSIGAGGAIPNVYGGTR